MKSVAIKLSSLLFIFAISFPSFACDPHNVVNQNADTDVLSNQMMQHISDVFNETSF